MAKFCQNCGTALGEGTKFCPGCGSPVPQAAPQQQLVQPGQTQPPQQPQYQQPQPQYQQPQPQYQQPVQQQRQYTPQPQVQIPQQFAQKNAAKAQKSAPAKKKKGKGGLVAVIVILLVAAIGVVCFFGFRDGGWFRGNKAYDAQSMQSLLEYAQQLEESGNSEAAEAVYELIIKGGGAELIEKAHEDIPIIKAVDEKEQLEEIFGKENGGNVQ